MLPRGNRNGRVEEIEVWQLSVDAVVADMDLFKVMVEGVVNDDGPFQCAALER